MKRLGVIGTLVWDRIWRRETAPGAEPLEEWGGIAYSLGALAAVRPPGWMIVPLLRVGRDLQAQASGFLQGLPGLQLGPGVRFVPEPNNRVELRYFDDKRRCEHLSGGVSPWNWRELEPLIRDLDALYLNFISGYELELPDMERLRAEFAGPIYADVHSLMLGRAADGRRNLRPLPEWRRWLRCFDAMQVNEDELAMLAGSWGDAWQFAAAALHEGVHLVLVTLADEGAVYFAEAELPGDPLQWRVRRSAAVQRIGPARTGRIAPECGPSQGDPTGCGDVWGSTLFASLLAGEPLESAMRRAHRMAARNLAHHGATGLVAHLRGELHARPA